MTDITAITATLSGIKTAFDIAKGLRSPEASLEKAELKLQLADLMGALAESKMSIIGVEDNIREKDREIEKLKEALKLKKKLVRHGEAYYETDEDDNPVGDPYCSHCFEVRYEAIHIHQNPRSRHRSVCPACKNEFIWEASRKI